MKRGRPSVRSINVWLLRNREHRNLRVYFHRGIGRDRNVDMHVSHIGTKRKVCCTLKIILYQLKPLHKQCNKAGPF